MIQGILEIFAEFALLFSDHKHRKRVRKKEKEDGIKRPFEKYFLQPSAKIVCFVVVLGSIGSLLFFTYQRNSIFPIKAKKEISEISNWVEKWYDKYESYPKDLNEAIGNNPMRQDWYKDAWGRDYKYSFEIQKSTFLIISAGRDGKFGTEDDISSR